MEKDSLAENSEVTIVATSTRKIPQRLRLQKIALQPEPQIIKPAPKSPCSKTSPAPQRPSSQQLQLLIITWNLMGTLPDSHSIQSLLTRQRMCNDLIVIGTQQCQRSLFTSFFCESKQTWEELLNEHMQEKFRCVGSEVLQGLHTIVFIKKEYYAEVRDLKSGKIKTGFMGVVGNKGAVELEFFLGERRLLFINSHLEAMQNRSTRRNSDLLRIVHRQNPADHIFFFGDLNYRLAISLEQAQLLNKKSHQYLHHKSKDQLIQQQSLQHFLRKYRQGEINFPPTYKMSTSNNSYSGTRIPGWTDRIFHCANEGELEQVSYECDFGVLGSDHRPVMATFRFELKRNKTPMEVEVRAGSRCCIF